MKYGVIDITSTSVSLKIYDLDTLRPAFSSRAAFSVQSFIEKGNLTPHGVQKAVAILKRMQEECVKYGAKALYVISASVLRGLKNADDVAAEIKSATGITVNRLDIAEEAYCDYAANKETFGAGCTLIDVSGGSIAVCDMSRSDEGGRLCLDFGALSVQKKLVKGVFPTEKEYGEIKKYLKKKFEKCGVPQLKTQRAVLAGNLSRSIGAIYSDVYCDGAECRSLEPEKLKKLLKRLAHGEDGAYLVIKNAPEKIYFITVALIILLQLLKRFSPDEVVISENGVKEGYLALCLSGEFKGAPSPVSLKKESVKISTVDELAEHIKRQSKLSPARSAKKTSAARKRGPKAKEKAPQAEKKPAATRKRSSSAAEDKSSAAEGENINDAQKGARG